MPMTYPLLDCRTGEKALYETGLHICQREGVLRFRFTARHSALFCPYFGYNRNHYEGDVCELFIGVGPNPGTYYEIEVTPNNDLFLGKITCQGQKSDGTPVTALQLIDREDCFVESSVLSNPDGYQVDISIPRQMLCQPEQPLFFNAYRIETDGGESEKHLFALNPTLRSKFHVPSAFVDLDRYLSK